MRRYYFPLLLIAALAGAGAIPLSAAAEMSEDKKKAERADIQKMANETLQRLYKTQPAAEQAIAKAAGYAVFSNVGIKIFVAGSGKGKGMAVDHKNKKVTYMRMLEVQAGLGMGVKKFRLVWVFENTSDFDDFVNKGWEFGGQASAAAKSGAGGKAYAGAISVSPGVWLYQLTDDGLALELTAKGTKYYKDKDLN